VAEALDEIRRVEHPLVVAFDAAWAGAFGTIGSVTRSVKSTLRNASTTPTTASLEISSRCSRYTGRGALLAQDAV